MTTISPKRKNALEIALFTMTQRARSFTNMLTEMPPKVAVGDKKDEERQTSSHAPIVRITDLSKTSGDMVDMQVVMQLNKLPTMGDRKISGRGEDIDFSTFEMMINQGRHQVDSGGKMSQQRTTHHLEKTGRSLLGSYFNNIQDQQTTVQLAGARGDFEDKGTIVPLATHSEFSDIMINPVSAPSYDNHFFGGDATSFTTLDSADVFSLEAVDNINLHLEEMSSPIQPIRYTGDEMAGDEPFYLLYVTPRQWADWLQTTSYKDWQSLTAAALTRSRNFKHPVFSGEVAMRGRILVRKYMGMPIRFNAGSNVSVSNNDDAATVTDQTAGVKIDRAMLLGGQALGTAWGHTSGPNAFSMHTERTDANNRSETTIAWMNGSKKIRFADKNGRVNDHGVMVLDTAVS